MNNTFITKLIIKRAYFSLALFFLIFVFAFSFFHSTGANAVTKPTLSPTAQFHALATAPNAPTTPTAVAGNSQATITWVAPASNGGAAITGYTVTSTPVVATPTACKTTNLTCILLDSRTERVTPLQSPQPTQLVRVRLRHRHLR